MELYIDNN